MPVDSGIYECPSCKLPLVFASSKTNVVVCTKCNTAVRRLDGDLLVVKPYLILNFRNELIQPGTKGIWQNQGFTVLGRVRYAFEETSYNYWTIEFANGNITMLAEGYGMYAIYEKFHADIPLMLPELRRMKCGAKGKPLELKTNYYLQRKDASIKGEVEGELQMLGDLQVSVFSFTTNTGRHAEIIAYSEGLIEAYRVFPISFSELQLSNLRQSFATHQSLCPSCKTTLIIKTYPYARSGSCHFCDVTFGIYNETSVHPLGKVRKDFPKPYIPIGTKGTYKGIDYEVIGYALKEEVNEFKSKWREYVLYNRAEGYAFLSEFDGHFIFIREQTQGPVLQHLSNSKFIYDDEYFQLYNKYSAKVLYTEGEFPGNIYNDRSVVVREFISPPEVWILEHGDDEITLFLGEHANETELAAAFSFQPPYKSGVGAVEPKGFVSIRKIWTVAATSALVIIFFHLVLSFTNSQKVLFDSSFTLPDSVYSTTIITPKFRLEKRSSNMEFKIVAAVNNSWFEVNGTLVNAQTGTEYSFEQGIEYYSGYSEGESWSEGSSSENVYLSSIPRGDYFLRLETSRQDRMLNSFYLSATYDVTMHRNLFIILGLLLIWPVTHHMIVQNNEKNRWSNSPFTPFPENE